MFNDKVLLITGGTGSFGQAVLKRFLDTELREIRIFSRDEKKQEELRLLMNHPKLRFYIGDVRDLSSLRYALRGVDYVFHAAALKQVPSCEFYPMEALRTNVVGTDNVLTASIEERVKRVIVLSTDKAVYPINAMGMTKAIAEKVMVARARTYDVGETVFCATRYGNVMASRGSVIPLFINQLQSGNPITITDPTMTRFLMSLEESVDLVLHAFTNGTQGDIFVKKSPASTMKDLAEALRQICGKPKHDICYIGTRHGEKLYETLVSREEMLSAVDVGDYYRLPADNRDLNYAKYFSEGKVAHTSQVEYTSHNTQRLTVEEIKSLLLSLDDLRGVLVD